MRNNTGEGNPSIESLESRLLTFIAIAGKGLLEGKNKQR
jgi:hypothetical protein